MGTIRDEAQRKALIERLGRVRPEMQPVWGSMSAPLMVWHLGAALDAALGERRVPRRGPALLRHFPMKHLAVYVIPMPKGAKAPPELLEGGTRDFEEERRGVIEKIERAAAAPKGPGPEHFLLGRLTNDQWGVLHWKHLDHHLRQFHC